MAPVVVKLLFTLYVVPLKTADPKATAPVNVVAPVAALVCVNAPVTVTAPLKFKDPLLVIVSAVKAVVPPTAPAKVIVPAVPPFKVKLRAPFTVLEKLIDEPVATAPALVVSKATFAPKFTNPIKDNGCPLVVILAFKLIAPTFVDPAVKDNDTPDAIVNALFTVIELVVLFCAHRATLVAAACIVEVRILRFPAVAQLGAEPLAMVPLVPAVWIVIVLGSSSHNPVVPMGARVLTKPKSMPRLSLPDVSTNPPSPPNCPPRAKICPSNRVI